MAIRLEIVGNHLEVKDHDTGAFVCDPFAKSLVLPKYRSGRATITDTTNKTHFYEGNITEFVNSTGVAFTESTLKEWFPLNTGFNPAPGGSGAVTDNFLCDNNTVTWTDNFYLPASGVPTALGGFSYSSLVPVLGSSKYTLKIGFFAIAWYNAAGTFISTSGTSSDRFAMKTYTSPATAAFASFNFQTSKKYEFIVYKGTDFYFRKLINNVLIVPDDRKWLNKKIAWYGTSIPAGIPQTNKSIYAYPDVIAKALGASIQNYAVGNSVIRSTKADGSPIPAPAGGAFSNTASTFNYVNVMTGLIGTVEEPDLFVFDFGVNDIYADATDINNPGSWNFASEDKAFFIGAYNFVLKALFTAKPTARVILVTHFSDDGNNAAFVGKNTYKNLNDAIAGIAENWNVPLLNLRAQTGIFNTNSIQNITTYCTDNIHPASRTDAFTVNMIAKLGEKFISNQ